MTPDRTRAALLRRCPGLTCYTWPVISGPGVCPMRRREFIALLGGAAAAWPIATRTQDLIVPLIGFLNSASLGPFARLTDAFRQGLRVGGYVEGRNVKIEYRWAEGEFARLPELAADLVHRRVSMIVPSGGTVSA